jgi:hypothetical protein
VNRYNRPLVTDRVPDLRHWRTKGRAYAVPWVTVVVDTGGAALEQVRHSVDALLTASFADLHVTLVGPWSRLDDARRSPLGDPDRELRLVQAEYAGEGRVGFVEDIPETGFPAPYRLLLPAGWAPEREAVARLAREMSKLDRGLSSVLLADGQVARLERTSAYARAARVVAPGEDLDDAVDAVSGTWWFDGVEEGFTWVDDAEPVPSDPKPKQARKPKGRGAGSRKGLSVEEEPAAPEKPKRSLRERLTGG